MSPGTASDSQSSQARVPTRFCSWRHARTVNSLCIGPQPPVQALRLVSLLSPKYCGIHPHHNKQGSSRAASRSESNWLPLRLSPEPVEEAYFARYLWRLPQLSSASPPRKARLLSTLSCESPPDCCDIPVLGRSMSRVPAGPFQRLHVQTEPRRRGSDPWVAAKEPTFWRPRCPKDFRTSTGWRIPGIHGWRCPAGHSISNCIAPELEDRF